MAVGVFSLSKLDHGKNTRTGKKGKQGCESAFMCVRGTRRGKGWGPEAVSTGTGEGTAPTQQEGNYCIVLFLEVCTACCLADFFF